MPESRPIVIVGAGPQLGAALARRFARGGHALALLARDLRRLEALAEEIRSAGGRARAWRADASDLAGLGDAIAGAVEAMGPPAALVYNVSRWRPEPATTLAPETLETDMRICASAALAASQAVLPAMRAAGGGALLWTGGGLALAPEQGHPVPALTAGKSAMRGLALAAAPSFRDAGVTLTTITVAGTIEAGSRFDPDRIAEAFWEVLAAPPDERPAERVFRGAP